MANYIVEWLSLFVRWTHIITGIAWIGSSFYFMWLDYHLDAPEGAAPKGVSGELWSVHGGGFYHVNKYNVAPEKIPKKLHEFKWESYATFISGFFLLGIVYYWGADIFLIDPKVMDLEPWQAIAAGIGFLIVGWLGYNAMCRSPLAKNSTVLALIGLVLLAVLMFTATRIFSGRGAFIHIGAMMGTIMALNVFMVIIPNQKKVIAAVLSGKEPDPNLGKQGKIRSTHNNYMTLPVIFTMLSNHYPAVYSGENNWLIGLALFALGGLIRHAFNLKNRGQKYVWPLFPALILFIGLFVAVAPKEVFLAKNPEQIPTYSEVAGILERRCVTCHAEKPTFPGMLEAPKNVILTDPKIVKRLAPLIHQQVSSGVMPLGNITNLTDTERQSLLEWVLAGANTDR